MAFKIGFTAAKSDDAPETNSYFKTNETTTPRRSVVQVYFAERHMTLAYYNDQFDLQCGDIVYVDGKLEGMQGRITDVNYNFKIKLSDYKRVIAVADTTVHGKFYIAGSYFLTFERNAIPYGKVLSWFKAPQNSADEFVSGYDKRHAFPLSNIEKMKTSAAAAERGYDYYSDNRVKYISLDGNHGYAIIEGREYYEVEFSYEDGNISGLVCTCFCGCSCKHEFAAMLQLREILELIQKDHNGKYEREGYFAAITKDDLFEFAVNGKKNGEFTI